MIKVSTKRGMKRKHDVGKHNLTEKDQHLSMEQHHSENETRRKYFNDTIPEEHIRSTLPADIAEEYLAFVQLCENRRKNKNNSVMDCKSPLKKKPRQQKKDTGEAQHATDGKKITADLKDNLSILNHSKSADIQQNIKKTKGRRRKNTTRNLLKCLVCSQDFPSKDAKQEHYEDHLGPRGYECTLCSKAFNKMPALVSHVSRIHLIDKKLACKVCGKFFRRDWLLRSHSLTHSSGRKFVCPTCKRGFTQSRHLFEHISGHVGFNPYKCEECGKRFQASSYLSLHRGNHVRVRPFKCKLCNIQCSSYSAIQLHTLMHAEKLGSECVDCNVRFPAHMRPLHIISHGREKNLLCNQCPAKFHANSVLRDHLKAHSCIREFNCDLCSKVLPTLSECSDHVCPKWVAYQQNAMMCPVCNLYLKKEHFDAHVSKHEKPSSASSIIDNEDDEGWDESGESFKTTYESGGKNYFVLKPSTDDEEDSDSSCGYNEYLSEDNELNASKINENSSDFSADCIGLCRETLDLENGLVQHMRQVENEVEEDESDNDDT